MPCHRTGARWRFQATPGRDAAPRLMSFSHTTATAMKKRIAFGVPLGSFQAVQHKCADMVIDLDTSRELAYEAVGCLSEHRPAASRA